MNPSYSIVCAAGHVADDELADEPRAAHNGTLRCPESGCFELIYSHCLLCGRPVPGHIDGPRMVTTGNISRAVGRIGTAGGVLPQREWREDCPYCKSPYPWAARHVWAGYHRRYLQDRAEGSSHPLHYMTEAEAAYRAEEGEARRRSKASRRRTRRSAAARRTAKFLDTWPKRIWGVVAAIAAVLGLVFGVNNLRDLKGGSGPATTTTSTATSRP